MSISISKFVRVLVGTEDGDADEAGGGDDVVDLLTCGSCRHQFPLSQFRQFVWHKVLGCDTPRPRRLDDVVTDRGDVIRSPPPGEDDVSSVTSRAGDVGEFRAAAHAALPVPRYFRPVGLV